MTVEELDPKEYGEHYERGTAEVSDHAVFTFHWDRNEFPGKTYVSLKDMLIDGSKVLIDGEVWQFTTWVCVYNIDKHRHSSIFTLKLDQ